MSESRSKWNIVVTDGPDQGQIYPVSQHSGLVIGRGSDSDTKIRDPRLSRVHCELVASGDHWNLLDRGGSGGTFVDEVRIDGSHPISIGSKIRIGDSELQLRRANPLDADTVAPAPSAGDAESSTGKLPSDGAASHAKPLGVTKIAQLEGEVFLRFRLEKMIVMGQNSVMFKAIDTKYGRAVAVKILKPQMVTTEAQKERFIRAMRTMLPVKHPNIVRTRKAGRTGPYCWAAFDWVTGISVRELIDRIGVSGMLDWKEVWRVGVHIGRALQEAEKHQIVHRNVTPSNLIRRDGDRAFLLTDLIFARALEYTDAPQLTRPGDVVGDLGYMAPERILDSTCVDARSDQYSLGATLYALLTGQPPYVAMGIADLVEKFRSTVPAAPGKFQMGLDERFCDVVMKMLSPSLDGRYSSPTMLLHDLKRVGTLAGIEADWSEWV